MQSGNQPFKQRLTEFNGYMLIDEMILNSAEERIIRTINLITNLSNIVKSSEELERLVTILSLIGYRTQNSSENGQEEGLFPKQSKRAQSEINSTSVCCSRNVKGFSSKTEHSNFDVNSLKLIVRANTLRKSKKRNGT